MDDELKTRKKLIRKEKRAARERLTAEERKLANALVMRHLEPLYQKLTEQGAKVFAGYLTDGFEPDLQPLFPMIRANGQTLVVPRFKSRTEYDMVAVETFEFPQSRYGIPEPAASEPVAGADLLNGAVWLIPGVAYDDKFHRLGRGAGVYDRLLSAYQPQLTIGIFYQCGRCDELPVEEHDMSLDIIVSDAGTFINPEGRCHHECRRYSIL